jgi:hypothetical protein
LPVSVVQIFPTKNTSHMVSTRSSTMAASVLKSMVIEYVAEQ